jgi:hypothetical protein
LVFVDESAEEVAWQESERLVRAVLVVVLAIDAEHMRDVAAAENEVPIEAVGANGPCPALGVGVPVWCSDRRAHHLDALRADQDANEFANPTG